MYEDHKSSFLSFDPKSDAEAINDALKGDDERAIINILCRHNNLERQQIRQHFKKNFSQDLIETLDTKLSSNVNNVVHAILLTSDEYDAHELHEAMDGPGTNESTLIEILCTRTNAQINAIRAAYNRLYSKELKSDIESDTSGSFKRLLLTLCDGRRDESSLVDPLKAKKDAQALYEAGEKRWGTDEPAFLDILSKENSSQLQLVFEEFKKIGKIDIEESIKKEFFGDVENALLTIVKCVKSIPEFFAERLRHSAQLTAKVEAFVTKIERPMPKHDQLIRIVVTRSEVDMAQINEAFCKKYNNSVESFISRECSELCAAALLMLVQLQCK